MNIHEYITVSNINKLESAILILDSFLCSDMDSDEMFENFIKELILAKRKLSADLTINKGEP